MNLKASARHDTINPMGFDWHVTGLTVGQVADRMQIAPSAVRWYADQGLLPHERVSGNHRRFYADVLCRVAMIRAAQQVGLSLGEIRTALDGLPAGQPPTRQDWERLAVHLRAVLNRRIDDLFALLDAMTAQSPEPAPKPVARSAAMVELPRPHRRDHDDGGPHRGGHGQQDRTTAP